MRNGVVLAMVLAGFFSQGATAATLWEDIDSYSSADAGSATPEQMTIDLQGRVIIVLAMQAPGAKVPTWGVRIGDGSGSWNIADTWQLSPGKWAYANGVAALPDGEIFISGRANNDQDQANGVIRKSGDGGKSWQTSSVFQLFPGQSTWAQMVGAVGQTLYMVGYGSDGSSTFLYVRQSLDHGTSWQLVDKYQPAPGVNTRGYNLAATQDGTLFVVGKYDDPTGGGPLVRKSSDQGRTWTTVDQFQYKPGASGVLRGAMVDSRGQILVSGNVSYQGVSTSIIRGSADGGATWQTYDLFGLTGGPGAITSNIREDANGNLYAVGSASDSTGLDHWITRTSSDGGHTWQVVDNYVGQGGKGADGYALAFDPFGTLFVCGQSTNPTDGSKEWIRQLVP